MKKFEDYLNNSAIIKILCKQRAKISHHRHKKHMMRDISYHKRTNRISISENDTDFIKIQSLFPSRRKWKKLNQKERLDPAKLTNSIEQNAMRLWKSYKVEKHLVTNKGKEPAEWYIKLLTYCNEIRSKIEMISSDDYQINSPEIIPLPKSNKNGDIIYRPVVKYSLEDKIITSVLSKYLTINFDDVFFNCSFAFRARKNGTVPNHHDAVVEILRYRKKYKKLWVAECDIQKFFDTVQHRHLLKIFRRSIEDLQYQGVNISPVAVKLFESFLLSYSFETNVLPKNKEADFFLEKGVAIGIFAWVEKDLVENFGENYVQENRIGVPQGNAISCFIANLILHEVDLSVNRYFKDVLYIRYCDDMILAHTEKECCKGALEIYKKKIRENYLLYHNPKKNTSYRINSKEFWDLKSKEPFFWGNKFTGEENVPWVSFVGYQINYKGKIRIRKTSIQREIRKQIQETQRILISLGMNRKSELNEINAISRKTRSQLVFSLQQRLISMSIGRVKIYNYCNKNLKPGLCWTNGFHLIRQNEISAKQLKLLDRRREQQVNYLKWILNELDKEVEKSDELPNYLEDLYFGFPYSYYGSLKRNRGF